MGREKRGPPIRWVKVGEGGPPLSIEERLRRDLDYIAKRTRPPQVYVRGDLDGRSFDAEPSFPSAGFGVKAEERWQDNLEGGRVAWRNARRWASTGLEYLEQGALGMAEFYLNQAKGEMLVAYDAIIEPKQITRLGTSAKPPGAKVKNAPLVQWLSGAMAAQKDLTGPSALAAALKDASLKAERDKDSRTDEALLLAVLRFRESQSE